MKSIAFYNTRTKTVDELRPLVPGRVRIYSCGPTVYSRQHIGNLRTYVFSDLLRRTLEYFGWQVRHVINVTDVGHLTDDASDGDDKIERAARLRGERALDVTEQYFELFQTDLARLNVREPTLFCKATEHIQDQIALAELLEARGFTYRTADGLYFDTSRDPDYGKLAGVTASRAHSRIAASGEKHHPADFALWKLSPPSGPRRQLEWASPWGVGFPGWHLECSAMATKYLGEQFEIHTGGVDHVPVHHVNEIAQSESAFDRKPWVQHWLHAGWLLLDGGKIAKSKGGALNLDDLVELGIEPGAFRYYLCTARYRAMLSFELEAARAARTAWLRLSAFAAGACADVADHPAATALAEQFDAALADDLDVPRALSVLWQVVRERSIPRAQRTALARRLAGVIGIELAPMQEVPARHASDPAIDKLVAERRTARAAGDFDRADVIRGELSDLGVVVEDTPEGPRWRRS